MSQKNIAVILCGSGFKDGSEIRESVAVLLALSKHPDVHVDCFALNTAQYDVVNCVSGQAVASETRNQLIESARIARGNVQDLVALDTKRYDGVIIPGGFGAAKNLCTFALEGAHGVAQKLVGQKLREFQELGKPIGAVCIAPMVVALALPQQNFQMTVGGKSGASEALETLGHRHVETAATDCCVDEKNKIVTSPAYMHADAPLFEIFEGIDKLVTAVIRFTK